MIIKGKTIIKQKCPCGRLAQFYINDKALCLQHYLLELEEEHKKRGDNHETEKL